MNAENIERNPRVHLLSRTAYEEGPDGESVGPRPIEMADLAAEYRTRYPGNWRDARGPLDDGELGMCAELLTEFAARLNQEITAGRLDPSARPLAEVAGDLAERVFYSRTGPNYS